MYPKKGVGFFSIFVDSKNVISSSLINLKLHVSGVAWLF